ncbi:MAG: beta-galactosidase, partial [Armatimonadetes bacterium]|nr:beta-galactosidase [Armatimonadota bacterium]
RDEYISRLLPTSEFRWSWALWTGAANGVADWLGKGDFVGKIDRAVKHSGETSICIVGKEAVPGSHEPPRGGYYNGPISLLPNTQYRFSVWYRTAGLPDNKALTLLLPVTSDTWLPASAEWKKHEVTFNSGANTSLNCYLVNFGVGTVWFDDASLVKVGDEGNDLLPNPGFELPGGPVPPAIVAGFPYASFPEYKDCKDVEEFGQRVLQTAQFRKGRLAIFRGFSVPQHQMMTPALAVRPMEVRQLNYDYHLSLASRAILWAAGKEPEVVVESINPSAVSLDRSGLAAPSVEFKITNTGAPAQAVFDFQLREEGGQTVYSLSSKKPIPSGASTVSFKLPSRIPAGSCFGDLWIRQNGKTMGWGSVGVNVTSSPSIRSLALTSEVYRQRQPVQGKVEVTNLTPGLSIELLQFDNFKRVVARRILPLTSNSLSFELQSPPPLTILQRVTARLLEDKGHEILDEEDVSFSISDLYPDPKDVRFVMWTSFSPASYIGRLMAREYFKHGVDTQYTGFSEWAPMENLWHLSYATRFTDAKTDWYQPQPSRRKDDHVRDPCLTNPEYLKKLREDLTGLTRSLGKYSTSDYALGDECMFVASDFDLCFSPTCVADFRRFAREEYGDLGKLNREWGTTFASWEEVTPITFDEVQKTGNIARWVDHRRHMETVWASIYQYSRQVINETAPGARTGYEGSDTEVGSFFANDYWKLAHSMNLNNIYFRDFLLNAVRDFSEPGTLLGGGWYGGYPGCRNEPFMRWFPWMTLLKGGNSLWVWYGSDGAGAVMAPDLSLYPFFKANVQEVKEIKSGIGKLLMSAKRQHDGIAMLYSPSSVHVATCTKGFPSMDQILNRMTQLLHNAGLECRVLSYEELKAGKLTNEEFKVLLLPGCQAMSSAEVEQVRRFATNGGTVVADLRPAVRNEHGTPYPQGALDDLFGVHQDPREFKAVQGVPSPRAEQTVGRGNLSLPALTTTLADGSLTVTQGKSLAKVEDAAALVTNDFGKGQGILLNFALPPAPPAKPKKEGEEESFRGWAEDAPMRDLVAQLLKVGGVQRPVALEPEFPKVDLGRFREGDLEYLGLAQNLPIDPLKYTNREAALPPAKAVVLRFQRRAHLYDMRAHRYLGFADSIKTDLRPGQAKLYALLPYKVSNLRVKVKDDSVLRPGSSVAYAVTVDGADHPAGTHVARLRVLDGKKQELTCYARNLLLERGRVSGQLNTALNDNPGTWTLVVTDVATGLKATANVTVRR